MALKVKSGSYTGNGSSGHAITGVGFQPIVLFIKGGSNITQVGTANMGSTKMQDITGATPATGKLSSYDADGFTLGTDTKVNASGTTYYYLALGGSGDIKTGTYAGNATGPRSITGVGFQPNLVLWWDDLGDTGGWRSSDMPSTDSWIDFGTVGLLTDRVFTLDADGFTVSFRNETNGTGRNYYYVALKNATSLFKVFTYSGNGSDDRNITGVGFQPDFALIKGTTNVAALRFKNETGDNSFLANATGEAANRVQSFISDGVQVGTAANVNTSSTTYYAWAFKESGAVAQTITPSFVSRSASTYAPTMGKGAVTRTPSFLVHAPTIFAPTVKGKNVITPSFLSRSTTIFAPTITKKYTVAPAFLSRSAALFAPTIGRGAVSRTPSFLSRTASVFPPTVKGLKTVTPSFLGRSASTYAPTVTTGAVTRTPAFLSRSATTFAPTVKGVNVLTPTVVSRSAVIYAPTVAVGAATVTPSKVSHSAAVYAPTVKGLSSVTPGKIARTPTVYTPSASLTVRPAKVTSVPTIFAPLLKAITTTTPPKVIRSATVYLPTVMNAGTTVSPSKVSRVSTAYMPVITTGPITLSPAFLQSLATVFAPSVASHLPGGDGAVSAVWIPGDDPLSEIEVNGSGITSVSFSGGNLGSATISTGDGASPSSWTRGNHV